MATQSWSTVINHTSDAAFRTWGSDLAAKMLAVGLTQTADTGQINWTTVVRAGTNADAGYEVWRFNDTQQASAPIFFKVYYGTGAATTTPRIRVEVGTGSGGAGAITGTAKSAITTCGGGAPASTVTAYQSYMCYVDGFFGFVFKADGVSAGLSIAGFMLCRSVDASGVATATGALALWSGTSITGSAATQSLRFAATAATFTACAAVTQYSGICMVPGVPTNSLTGTDLQAYTCWMQTPRVQPLVGLMCMFKSELSTGSTTTVAMVGVTTRTYIQMACQAGCPAVFGSGLATAMGLCMLWE